MSLHNSATRYSTGVNTISVPAQQQNQHGSITPYALVTVVLMSVLLFVVYHIASGDRQPGLEELLEENRFLRSELDVFVARNESREARLAVLERETEVVRQANRLLREEEAERQAQINQLQTEVDFFSRLAGTGGQQAGLAVHQLELMPTGSERVFRFTLTLTQNIQRASIISGKASLDVEGILEDRPVTLYWAQLAEGFAADNSFRFKYFQQLEGYLTLPESFDPTRLVVSLDVKGQRKPVTRTFDWIELNIQSGIDTED